jgi:hypothetical protein
MDDVHGLGAVVAADVEEISDVLFGHYIKNGFAIFGGWFASHGAQGRGRGLGDGFHLGLGYFAQIHEVAIENALDAVFGAEDGSYLLMFTGGEYGTREALVDDHGWAAALGD